MSAESIRHTRGRPDRVHYRQNGVEVTSRYLTVRAARYEIDEMADIMLVRGATHPGVKIGAATAVVEAAVIAPLAGVVTAPFIWVVAAVALAVPALVAVICAIRWPAQFGLIARYRGREVTLFTTRDAHEFGLVTRALRRAVGV
jgi:Family of unknown function (DUF6232)